MDDEERNIPLGEFSSHDSTSEVGEVAAEVTHLASQVTRLEAEHLALKELLRAKQTEVIQKKRYAQESAQTADELRQSLFRMKARELSLGEELDFLEEERAGQDGVLVAAMDAMRRNLAEIEKTTRQIEFIKGELDALAHHVDTFKEQVPERFTNNTFLEGKISQTGKEFMYLIDRIKDASKDLNLSYYQKKRELRRKYDPYGFDE